MFSSLAALQSAGKFGRGAPGAAAGAVLLTNAAGASLTVSFLAAPRAARYVVAAAPVDLDAAANALMLWYSFDATSGGTSVPNKAYGLYSSAVPQYGTLSAASLLKASAPAPAVGACSLVCAGIGHGTSSCALNGDGSAGLPATAKGLAQPCTVAFWAYLPNTTVWSHILDLGNGSDGVGYGNYNIAFCNNTGSSGPNVQLQVNYWLNGTKTYAGYNYTGAVLSASNPQWYHLAVVFNGAGTASAYLNGALQGSFTAYYDATVARAFLGAGRSQWPTDPDFSGALDELRVYYAALSAAQIATLYAQRGATAGAVSASTAALSATLAAPTLVAGVAFSASVTALANGLVAPAVAATPLSASGLAFSVYTNNTANTSTTPYPFNWTTGAQNCLAFFASAGTPAATGTATSVAGYNTSGFNAYGGALPASSTPTYCALSFAGYFRAPASGTHVFTFAYNGAPNDDLSVFWLGAAGQTLAALRAAATNANYQKLTIYTDTLASAVYSATLVAGALYPLLLNYGQFNGGAILGLGVTIPGASTPSYDGSGLFFS